MDGDWGHGKTLEKMDRTFSTWNPPKVKAKTRDF